MQKSRLYNPMDNWLDKGVDIIVGNPGVENSWFYTAFRASYTDLSTGSESPVYQERIGARSDLSNPL